ncbi:PEP/pyruvate-binding domain-containing protein [Nitrospira sp. Kam-Ns4a]
MSSQSWVIELREAWDPGLCGGKASSLARLLRLGIPVPDGICLTTALSRTWLEACGALPLIERLLVRAPGWRSGDGNDLLAAIRWHIEEMPLLPDIVAVIRPALARLIATWHGGLVVRSSATCEDTDRASHAGIYASYLGLCDPELVLAKVKACWAALWTEQAWAYRQRAGLAHPDVVMAVIVQGLIAAERAGVAFSADPISGERSLVRINAVWGIGEPLMAGRVIPDEFTVRIPDESTGVEPVVAHERIVRKTHMTIWRDGRLIDVSVPRPKRRAAVLTEPQALQLAKLVKQIERCAGTPQDVEWAFDGHAFWILQARPISILPDGTAKGMVWTRANLKEIFPEQPSVLALSYLQIFLDRMFRAYYGKRGYPVPPEVRLVKSFRGRPYLNLTLLQQMTAARGGEPGIVPRLLGGADSSTRIPVPHRPTVRNRELLRLACELAVSLVWTPVRAQWLFRHVRTIAKRLGRVPLQVLTDQALQTQITPFMGAMVHEATLCRIQEVISAETQVYLVLENLLAAWLPERSPELLGRLLTGLGTLPNARLTHRLMALGALARREERVRIVFSQDARELARRYRAELAGTRFLAEFEQFLDEFGHRAPYESDVMSPRFREDPTPLFRILQAYVQTQTLEEVESHVQIRRHVRRRAVEEVRQALFPGWREGVPLRWWIFRAIYGGLCRLLALRDEVRHVTTLLVVELRRVALEIGRRAVQRQILTAPQEIFLVTWEELPTILLGQRSAMEWARLLESRRHEREQEAALEVPDLLEGEHPSFVSPGLIQKGDWSVASVFSGLGVSPGCVTGKARVLRAGQEVAHLDGADILVLPVIDPVWTPLFPLVRGLVAEMGGMLSHGAILAREYGLPTVVNVPGIMDRLQDGDLIHLDGATGQVQVLEKSANGKDPVACSPHSMS